MPTTNSFSATGLYWRPGGGTWQSGNARQGQNNGNKYHGRITFDFSSIDVSNINVTSITMTFHIGDIGGSYKKYLYLHVNDYNGTSVGTYSLGNGVYNTNRSITFSASSNTSGFNILKDWVENGGWRLGLYYDGTRGKSSSKTFDYDYMSVTSMTLDVTYEYKKSIGTISDSQTGSDSVLNITAYNNTYYHKVTWSLGNNTYGPNTIAAGVTEARYTIPHSWLPNSVSGTASVTLQTFDSNDNSLGSNTYTFNVSVPSSITPTISGLTIIPVNYNASQATEQWGVYIQGKYKASVSISSASQGTGASGIVFYSITSSPNYGSITSDTSSPVLLSNILSSSGTVTFSATVTDSRGRSATISQNIIVQQYNAPSFTTTPIVFRCTSQGVQDEVGGTYASVTASFAFSSVASHNALTSTITLNNTASNITSGQAVIIGGGLLQPDLSYVAVISLTDSVGTTVTYDIIISSAEYLFHFAKGGKSIGIGRAAASNNDKKVHIGWEMELDHALNPASGGTGQTSLQATRNAMGLGNTLNALPAQNGGTGETSLQATRNAMGLGNTTGALPIANGGTDASTSIVARTNLGAACGVYDTSGEIDTGNDWIDGSRIYRRVCTSTASAKTHVFSTSDWNMDRPIRVYGMVSFTDSGKVYWVPIVDAEGNNYSISVSHVDGSFRVWSNNRTFTNVAMIVEYIKVTT